MNAYKKDLRELYPYAWRWISVARRIGGWLTDAEANTLYEVARTRTPERATVIVELGSWQGKSSVLLAAGLLGKPGARLYCVDPFGEDENPELQSKHYAPLIHNMRLSLEESFQRNIRRCGVGDIVQAIRGYSYEVVRSWTQPIDMLFIDASHEYESVYRDFALWSPFVRAGGIIALHDVSLAWPGPTRVMKEELQPPQYDDLHQTDSLAWSIKQQPVHWKGNRRASRVASDNGFETHGKHPAISYQSGNEGAAEGPPRGSLVWSAGQQSAEEGDDIREFLIGGLERFVGQVAFMKAEMSRLTSDLTAQAETAGRLKAELALHTEEADSLEKRVEFLTAALAEKTGHCSSLETEVHRLTDSLAKEAEQRGNVEREVKSLADELDRQRTRVLALCDEVSSLHESKHALQALRRSWSWRLTAPLRAVVDLGLRIRG